MESLETPSIGESLWGILKQWKLQKLQRVTLASTTAREAQPSIGGCQTRRAPSRHMTLERSTSRAKASLQRRWAISKEYASLPRSNWRCAFRLTRAAASFAASSGGRENKGERSGPLHFSDSPIVSTLFLLPSVPVAGGERGGAVRRRIRVEHPYINKSAFEPTPPPPPPNSTGHRIQMSLILGWCWPELELLPSQGLKMWLHCDVVGDALQWACQYVAHLVMADRREPTEGTGQGVSSGKCLLAMGRQVSQLDAPFSSARLIARSSSLCSVRNVSAAIFNAFLASERAWLLARRTQARASSRCSSCAMILSYRAVVISLEVRVLWAKGGRVGHAKASTPAGESEQNALASLGAVRPLMARIRRWWMMSSRGAALPAVLQHHPEPDTGRTTGVGGCSPVQRMLLEAVILIGRNLSACIARATRWPPSPYSVVYGRSTLHGTRRGLGMILSLTYIMTSAVCCCCCCSCSCCCC